MKTPYIESHESRLCLADNLNQLLTAKNIPQLQQAYHNALEEHRFYNKLLKKTYREKKSFLEGEGGDDTWIASLARSLKKLEEATDVDSLGVLFNQTLESYPKQFELLDLVYKQRKAHLEGKEFSNKAFLEKEKKVRKRWMIALTSFATMIFLIFLFFSTIIVADGNFRQILNENESLSISYKRALDEGSSHNVLLATVLSKNPRMLISTSTFLKMAIFSFGIVSVAAYFFYHCCYKKRGTYLLGYSIFWIPIKLLPVLLIYIPLGITSLQIDGFDPISHIFPPLFFALAFYFVCCCWKLRKVNKREINLKESESFREVLQQLAL